MSYTRDLKRLTTRAELARAFGVDPRQKLIRELIPVAILIAGQKEIELFEANIPASFALNTGRTQPKL